ncbi:MAG: hypothetical protein QOJ09_197 [Actinomycetota bacterium]|nr:hypothetical protein [Actinomycetota bacterium]
MSTRPRRLALLLAAMALLPGCVHQGNTKVTMSKLEADLTFGVVKPETPPPNFGSTGSTGDTGSLSDASNYVDVGALDKGFVAKPRPRIGSGQVSCPEAALNAFPEKEAGTNVDAVPTAGSYRWKRGGQTTYATAPDRPIPNAGFETHLVRNIAVIKDQPPQVQPQGVQVGGGGKEFTFETVQPTVNGLITVSSWRVKTDATSATPRQLTVNGPNQGEPERGLSLEKLETQDKSGASLATYSFPSGVLYMPLPANPGTKWSSVGVDPKSGVTLSMDGTIVDHKRVDACGDIVDGWQVTSTQTFSGTDSQTIKYDFIVAPQYGGILTNEKVDQNVTAPVAAHLQFDNVLGQLKPGPLPTETGQ